MHTIVTKLIRFVDDKLRTLLAIFPNLYRKYIPMAGNLLLWVAFRVEKKDLNMLFPLFQIFYLCIRMPTDLPAYFSLLRCMHIIL